jgi:hypothetical protein
MAEIDHDAAIRTMRALADDMDNWPDEDNYSVALNNLIALASAAKGLAEALQANVDWSDGKTGPAYYITVLEQSRAALATFREIGK